MPAKHDAGRPDFDPKDKPVVRLTEMGRALGSVIRFPDELEKIIPKFLEEKARKEVTNRTEIAEDWFDAKVLLEVMGNLYDSVSFCQFHPEAEAGIQKAARRMLQWDDLGKELSDEEVTGINSFVSWCLLIGIRLERQRKLTWKEILAKISQTRRRNKTPD